MVIRHHLLVTALSLVQIDGSGVDAIFVLYVSAVSLPPSPTLEIPSSTLLAYAGACKIERNFDRYSKKNNIMMKNISHNNVNYLIRPIVGFANFCPLAIDSVSDESMIMIAKYELLHPLVSLLM